MKQFFCLDTKDFIEQEIELFGWVHARRDHGKIIFLDLRDCSGLVQLVISPSSKVYNKAQKLGVEYVVRVKGKVKKRPKNMTNPKLETGKIEIEVSDLEILSTASPPIFAIDENTQKVKEEKRLKYRYLDLRTERMKNNLLRREQMQNAFRCFLKKYHFSEIETPYLTKGTPEGAREYVVPSRIYKGNFYVLPQSPQQFKQLLMVAGIERYFQFARCFRDEDPRGDRQPEFTQLDIEMSFIKEETLLRFIEKMVIKTIAEVYPNKKIAEIPFPRFTYEKAMAKFNTDKPDLRKNKADISELAFVWVVDAPLLEWSETEKKLVSTHHPFTAPKEKDIEKIGKMPEKVRAQAYDLVLNGSEIAGGSIRIHQLSLQKKIFEILGLSQKEISEKFGHMLEAFSFGVPPHGGIAFGFDRLIMILQNEKNIREVIPFPKTGDARDLLMSAPSRIEKNQLRELGISLKKSDK